MARVLAGTSGFAYKGWKGPFYPEDLKNDDMLGYYAGQLPSVEINNTFYRMPKREVLEKWAGAVGDDFRFIIKASRRITHFQRLKNSDDSLDFLLGQLESLGDSLGAILFQTPPNMKCDLERLEAFLGALPGDKRAAFEFRNVSWFQEDTYALLRASNAALCIADTGGESDAPLVATADWGYLRLRQMEYGDDALEEWAGRIGELGWKDTYAFFKHEDEGAGPKMARRFQALCDARL